MLVHESVIRGAEKAPDKDAIVDEFSRVTYAELVDESLRVARVLRDEGLQAGDRVALYLDNTANYVSAILGTLMAGGVVVPVNPQTRSEKLALILADSGAAVLVAEGHALNVAADAVARLPRSPRVFAARAAEAGTTFPKLEEAVAAAEPRDVELSAQSGLALLVYTSGTTGEPKGVMLGHEALVFVTGSIAEYLQLGDEERIMSILPLAFTYGLSQLLLALHRGGTLLLERTFAFPGRTLERMHNERATMFGAVPTVFATLLGMQHSRTYDSVRCITNAAAALPPSFHDGIRQLFPQARLYRMYGQTECVRISYLDPELLDEKPTSVGVAIPGTEVIVLDEEGKPVSPGETGVLYVRGPHLMSGYWGDPELTAETLTSGDDGPALCTRDHFTVDEDGLLYFVGRSDDIIKSRGEKVSTAEVENVLHALVGVSQVAVVGVPDELLGEAVRAYVVALPGAALTAEAVLRFARSKLESFMVPRDVVFVDRLPHTESGKIRKRALLDDAAGAR
jgi:long-chain acyl-CoA synthetase